MTTVIRALAALFIATLSVVAIAHEDHGKPQHGGVVAEGGVFQAELVASPTKLALYLTNHGKPVDTKGSNVKLTVLASGKKSEIALVPAGENRLEATIVAPLGTGARVVGVVTLAGQQAVSVRWAMK